MDKFLTREGYKPVMMPRTIYRPVTRPKPSEWSRDIFDWK
jgi:hypothetical protein